jgi:opacity protein-like surface antigen
MSMSFSRNKLHVAALAMLSSSAAVPADETARAMSGNEYYVELRAGANFLDESSNGVNASPLFGAATDYDGGYTTGIALGRSLADLHLLPENLRSLRVEAEYARGESDLEWAGTGNAELAASAFMANLYYDLPLAPRLRHVRPFIGGGIGALLVDVDGTGLRDGDDTVFAYQLRAGLAYAMRPQLDLTLGYRFVDADDPEFEYAAGSFESEYRSHAVEAGLRYRF